LQNNKYKSLLQYKVFARVLILTGKNHIHLDIENSFINDSEIPFFTILGDSDSAAFYSVFNQKLDKLMQKN
tara:strand:- start:121 stop:333 length:213 start_codon:yes stop_codon:yes gene_type:complete